MMALDAMNLSITEVDVNMDKGEHRSPELAVVSFLEWTSGPPSLRLGLRTEF